jgi:excisionase family DNA binding protein
MFMTNAKELLAKLISDPASASELQPDMTSALLLENSALQSTLAGVALRRASREEGRPAVVEADGQLMTAGEVAVMLGVPKAYVYELARRRELPAVQVGRKYRRFRRPDVERYIQQRTNDHGTERTIPASVRPIR